MALLTKETQEKIVNLVVAEGLADAELVAGAQAEAAKTRQPILSFLTAKKIVDDDIVAHAAAVVLGMQYVNLTNVRIEQEILLNLPQDVAERSMAVPVAEGKDGRLVVAMLDAGNIQAVDYLSTLIQKPIKTVVTSEEGIRAVLIQYKRIHSH